MLVLVDLEKVVHGNSSTSGRLDFDLDLHRAGNVLEPLHEKPTMSTNGEITSSLLKSCSSSR